MSKRYTHAQNRWILHPSSAIFWARLAKAAARSIWPTTCPPGFAAPPPGFGGAGAAPGLTAVGIGGLPPTGLAAGFGGAPGFAAIGGGLGLFAIGGGGLAARELPGLELAGVLLDEALAVPGVFFHGVADPLDGPMPGKTDTGLADESATTDLTGTLAAAAGAGVGLEVVITGVGVTEGGRRFGGGGGGGGAAAAFGFGGTSSR